MWIQRLGTYVQTTRKTFVQTIEPAEGALSMEEPVKLFSAAFEQVCDLRVVDELVCNGLFVFVFCGVCSYNVEEPIAEMSTQGHETLLSVSG